MNESRFELQPGKSSITKELSGPQQHGLYFEMGLEMVRG